MTYRTPVTDADLHAYVDDQLEAGRRREVEDYLHAHAQAAARVEEYRRVNAGLRALYDPVLGEPVPAALRPARRDPRRWPRVAAVAGWLLLGGVGGWLLHPAATVVTLAEGPMQRHLVQPAAFAHRIYAAEIRHPVEVGARDEPHLVAWLSRRLHTDIKAPALDAQGYILMGGRLLPSTDRMAAQFMYERADGLRVTLYIRQGVWKNEETAFRFASRDGVGVFYWIDGPLGYALVGELDRGELSALSEAVHRQLH
ncbi:MAG TPA: anti-sigma factor [Acidiferrobacterales bacterium]